MFQVNDSNRSIVAAIFEALGDGRFNLRTPDAAKRGAERRNVADVTGDLILGTAQAIGCPILHRNRDGVPLIGRPIYADASRRMTWNDCRSIAARADGGESFTIEAARSFEEPAMAMESPTDAQAPDHDDDDDGDDDEPREE